MAKDMKVNIEVSLKDSSTSGIKKIADEIEKSTKKTVIQAKQAAQEQQQVEKQTDQVRRELATKSEMYSKRLAQSRGTLGIRSEREIQSEIRRTQQAYQLLARSGSASANDLKRASAAVKQQVKELNAELGKTSKLSQFKSTLGNIGRGVTGIAAGATAAGMVLREPMRKEMTYDRELAMVSNTAFSDRDVAGRIAGKQELHHAVKTAVETGGGTKEDALGALDKLLASGTVKADTAMRLLPTLQKGAVATGASSEDLASIAISSMQQFHIDEKDIGKVLDMAVAAGQAGNFELADMARWLPQQMAAAKSTGLTGLDGFKTLLIANQQAMVTAGTSDEAGNNLVNLLAKLTSKETLDKFSKLEHTDKKGKKYDGYDYLKMMEKYKSRGQDSLQAFMSIMDTVVGDNKEYQNLQKKLKTAKTEERTELLNQMANLVEGTAIGKVISDRQALMALLGIRNNVQLGKEVDDQVQHSDGAVDTSHQVIKSTNDYKVEDAKNMAEFAQMQGMKGFDNVIGQVSSKLADYAREYPDLTAKLAGAATGVAALSAAAIAAAGSLTLLKFGKGGSGVGDLIKTAGKSVGESAGNVGKTVASASRFNLLSGAGGWFTKGALGIGLMLHSEELNRGEDESLDFNKRLVTGNATVDELAQNDTAGAKNLDEVAQRRQQREAMYAQKGIKPLEGQALEEYNLLVDRYFKQVLQTRYDKAVETLNSHWFTSAGEKEKAMDYLNSLNSQDLTTEQATQVASLRKGYISDRGEQAQGTLASMWSSDEEKQKARAYLDETSPKALRYSQGYQGMTNANLGKPSLLHTQETQSDRLGFDLTPLVSSQERTFGGFQMSLSSDIAQFGQQISEGLMSAIQAQEQKIENVIRVELDGRLLSEQVSEYQYQAFKRG